MNRLLRTLLCVLVVPVLAATAAFAQTGKISGQVTDAATGEPLPGVNVVIEGTTQGTATDVDGYYSILNVEPGSYNLRATYIGFSPQVITGVQVNVDLTTTVNIEMEEEAMGLDEVVVQAEEPLVRPDISANVSNLSSEDMENMPLASLEDMIGLQAGIEGLSVRGGDVSSLGFIVDGASTFDGRSNTPFTGVSFTSIEQVQIQTGGFNAEYGNVRSGLINVVTKDGPRNRYIADVMMQYSPPGEDYFGALPSDPNAYWMRPYLDPAVAFEGTHSENSPWDAYQRRQFPEWEGWNSYAERAMNDEDPNNDLTPEQWREVFQWYRRKDFNVTNPDYTFDGSFGGPVPGISEALGDLRFFASYRQTQDAYLIPQTRDAHRDYLGRLRLTSDIAPRMKLELQGMMNRETGLNATRFGYPQYFTGRRGDPNQIDEMLKHVKGYHFYVFANDGWSMQDVDRYMGGLSFTHTLSPETFYEVQVNHMASYYTAFKGRYRDDSTIVHSVGTLGLTEAPFGFDYSSSSSAPDGMALGGYYSSAEDSSWSKRWDAQADLTSQITRFSQLKGGVSFNVTEHRRLNRGTTTGSPSLTHDWQRATLQGAAYVQNKLEFEGLIANLGLRLDYFEGRGDWYRYSLFDTSFAAAAGDLTIDDLIEQQDIEAHVGLSPRLGVSFPITTYSKLFFNYGHFREPLEPNNIFRIDRIGSVGAIGNPNHPMPKTVAYELGYEHNLFNRFLLRMTGYYKDLSDQPRNISFTGDGGNVNYSVSMPFNYEDIRGFELSLTKVTGYIRGFVNYTYMASKSGNFGFGTYFENPVDRIEYLRDYRNRELTPVPQPYARASVTFMAPADFGPEVLGTSPLADWRLNVLGSWRAGRAITWCGGGGACPSGIQNNVRWADSYMLDMRLSKVFNTRLGQAQFFVDVDNALNRKELNPGAFMGIGEDERLYMESLHLAADVFEDIDPPPYRYIPGDDRPGDYRKEGVAFVPIEIVESVEDVGNPQARPLYYEAPEGIQDGTYYQYVDGAWQEADPELVNQVLEDKAYIDMPNLRSFTFLYPREFTFGLRLTF